jgi:hypothetical protein
MSRCTAVVGKEILRLVGARSYHDAAGTEMQECFCVGRRIVNLHRAQQIAFIDAKATAVEKGCDLRMALNIVREGCGSTKSSLFFKHSDLLAQGCGFQRSF